MGDACVRDGKLTCASCVEDGNRGDRTGEKRTPHHRFVCESNDAFSVRG